MIAGLDSALAPSSSAIAQAHAAGVRLWAGYFAGPNIYNGWSKADFDRVKAGGLSTLAYCSGWSDAAAMKAQSASWGVPICLDVEGGIRAAGLWMPIWLAEAGSGLYGNLPVHSRMPAAFHILAAYSGYDPGATWSGVRPSAPCGWQWQGTHSEFGVSVDRGWYDDVFAGFHGAGSGNLGEEDLTPDEHTWLKAVYDVLSPVSLSQIQQEVIQVQNLLEHGTDASTGNPGSIKIPTTAELLTAIQAVSTSGSGLTQQQVTDAVTAALKGLTLKAQ